MSLLSNADWSFPVPVAFGPGRLKDIAKLCKDAGISHPLIVTDRGSANLPFMTNLVQYLADDELPSAVYSNISPNPRDDEIAAGRALYRSDEHDGIIAIGGGSGMDGGKAIALTATNDIALWDFEFERPAPDMSGQPPFPPLITIPTTAGTGAETESTAMITDTERLMKWCVWHSELKPTLALLDPEITVGLPATLTAWTGADALVHAIEAYCVPGFHPMCDGVALEGLRLISRWLPEAVKNPSNLEARGGMLAGSCLAGVAFLKGLGLVHAISHMIGAEFDTQHGLTNAILLPAVLRYNAPEIENKVGPMALTIGLTDTSFETFHAHICALLDEVCIPRTLTEIGVPSDCVQRIAEKALQDSAAATNPRVSSTADVAAILTEALEFGR